MQNFGAFVSEYNIDKHGINNPGTVYWNLTTPMLYEQIIRRREGVISHLGPIIVRTGDHTGRSPSDKFVVKEPSSEDEIWWGKINQPISEANYNSLYGRLRAYLQNKDVFVFDGYVGADPQYRKKVRFITELAYHALFVRNMFIREFDPAVLRTFVPDMVVINVPSFHAVPEEDGTRSQTFIIQNLAKSMTIIGGTAYAGENKKSIFSAMNYYLPKQGVMSMHCSANYGKDKDDAAIFFGLSGTGKTTLSADPERTLIGDDEHGWSDNGVFNLEGGCYAKVIRLDPEGEPEIFETTRRFGTVLENVAYDSDTRHVDLDDDSLTENTRSSYPISHIPNADPSGMAGHPKNIMFLTADAFGVLPPISKLTKEQAMYHFLSGYTAKVAGTEIGITEPSPIFSACFGAPFMPLHPGVYAELLGEKIDKHGSDVWLINTGWTGGPFGVGSRMKLKYTRRMVAAALAGELADVETVTDPTFGVQIPVHVEGVPDDVLMPRKTWADGAAYDAQSKKLAGMFVKNFAAYADGVSDAIKNAGPKA